ncbi:hypothetical protein PIB30_092321, partial [Stylosanthes scabra]|nr:hypothetical protein [Stylosanthes scabra]
LASGEAELQPDDGDAVGRGGDDAESDDARKLLERMQNPWRWRCGGDEKVRDREIVRL